MKAEALAASEAARQAELLRDQVKHGIETYRFAIGLLVQVWGFLAAANALLLAYGLNLRAVAPFVIAGSLPLLMWAAYYAVLASTLPIGISALVAERSLGGDAAPLVETYAKLRYPGLLRRFEELAKGSAGTAAAIGKVSASGRALRSRTLLVFGTATMAQWAISLYLACQLDWPLFGAPDTSSDSSAAN